MYTPKKYEINDMQEAISFMQRYNFGTVISVVNNLPVATHLPFLVNEKDGRLIISSHFAKANPHAKEITNGDALVIFTEPHAYISPKHYEKEEDVPTWNYIAVHAYGKAHLIDDHKQLGELLEQMINYYEADYLKQWNSLPEHFRVNMMRGIVGFEIEVTDIHGKQKLSQNKTELERQRIINELSKSPNTNESDIAAYMKLREKD